MRIVNERLLEKFRLKRYCEWCKGSMRFKPHVHHLFSRGAGRLDIPENLIALCGPWDGNCHGKVHDGHIMRDDLLAVVAQREGLDQEQIREMIYRLRRSHEHESTGEGESRAVPDDHHEK